MKIKTYLKNLPGWRTNKKFVCFSVDDFGNIFLHSKSARENLEKAGLDTYQSRFSRLDILENTNDLTALYEVLTSVRDSSGNNPVFTAFTTCVNIDFDAVERNQYTKYAYKNLADTYSSLPGYESAWKTWTEGVEKGLLVPEFHGREHLNVAFLETLMAEKDPRVVANLENRSWAALGYLGRVGFTEAFAFNNIEEVNKHHDIIRDGLHIFENLFGRKARHFNAPGAREHHSVHETLKKGGIKLIDADLIQKEHQGQGTFKRMYNPFGRKNEAGLTTVFRNCVFEPNLPEKADWVDHCLTEINIAFSCGKPANISSHRVNFVGGIEPSNRDLGLTQLKKLLDAIVRKWPEVEFVSSFEIGKNINNSPEIF